MAKAKKAVQADNDADDRPEEQQQPATGQNSEGMTADAEDQFASVSSIAAE